MKKPLLITLIEQNKGKSFRELYIEALKIKYGV